MVSGMEGLLEAAFPRHSSQAEPNVPIPHFHRLSTYLLSNQTPLVDYPSIWRAGLRAPEGQRCCHIHLGFLTPDWGWMLSSCSVFKESGKESWNVPNLLTTHMTYKYNNTFEIRHCTLVLQYQQAGTTPRAFFSQRNYKPCYHRYLGNQGLLFWFGMVYYNLEQKSLRFSLQSMCFHIWVNQTHLSHIIS